MCASTAGAGSWACACSSSPSVRGASPASHAAFAAPTATGRAYVSVEHRLGGARERRRGDRVGAAVARPRAGLRQRIGRSVVRADARRRQVPRSPVDISVGKRRCQRRVRLAALRRGSVGVHRRTRQWMGELGAGVTHPDQACLLGRLEIAEVQADAGDGACEHGKAASVARRRDAPALDGSTRKGGRNDVGTLSAMLVEIGTGASLGRRRSREASGASSSSASGLPPVARYRRSSSVGWEHPRGRAASPRLSGLAQPFAAFAGRCRPAARPGPRGP